MEIVKQEKEKKESITSIIQGSVLEEVWENERKHLFSGYSGHRLLPTDPHNFTTKDSHYHVPKEDTALPEGWYWYDDWTPARSSPTDEDGWEYAWNFTSKEWRAKDASGCWVRRRRWNRIRKKYDKKPSVSSASETAISLRSSNAVSDLIDLSSLRFLYSCKATRSKKEIVSMLNFDPEIKIVMVNYQTPNSFFCNWSKFFAETQGRSQSIINEGIIFVIYELDDEDVLFSILLPIITESGEYVKENGVASLQKRFSKFGIVLAGWKNSHSSVIIPKVLTEHKEIPPIKITVNPLE